VAKLQWAKVHHQRGPLNPPAHFSPWPHRPAVSAWPASGPSGSEIVSLVYVYEMLTIGLIGAAATAVVARNILGIAKDWIDLTKNTKRSVTVTIGDKVVEIKQGDDILAIVQQHFPDEGGSNSL
jgi:hypothetical protein